MGIRGTININLGTRHVKGRKAARAALKQGSRVEAYRVRKYLGEDEQVRLIGSTSKPHRLDALVQRGARGIAKLFEAPEYDYVELRIRDSAEPK